MAGEDFPCHSRSLPGVAGGSAGAVLLPPSDVVEKGGQGEDFPVGAGLTTQMEAEGQDPAHVVVAMASPSPLHRFPHLTAHGGDPFLREGGTAGTG